MYAFSLYFLTPLLIDDQRLIIRCKIKKGRLSSFPSVEGSGFFSNQFLNDLTLLGSVNIID